VIGGQVGKPQKCGKEGDLGFPGLSSRFVVVCNSYAALSSRTYTLGSNGELLPESSWGYNREFAPARGLRCMLRGKRDGWWILRLRWLLG
jgi:hypothetical protein